MLKNWEFQRACVYKFSSSSPHSSLAKRRLPNVRTRITLIVRQVESHCRLRSVLLGYASASASDGRFARPTDRPTLLLLIPLSIFFPRPFRIFVSPLFSRYALRYEPSFDFRGWYFRFYSRHSVRVGEREEGEFPSPTFFIPNPKEYRIPRQKVLGSLRSR